MKAGKFDLIFEKKITVAKNTFEFHFKKPKTFNFKPGQYLKVRLDIKNPDERGSSRYFTVSSSPNKSYLTITTRVIQSSFKKSLVSLRKGDKMHAFGPLGYFDFNVNSGKSKIFLAGGMGATPYHSILTTIFNKRLKFDIALIVSASFKDELVYFEEFKRIEKENQRIKVVSTLTKEKVPGFEHVRINKSLIVKHVPEYKKAEFFVVGPEAFEAAMLALLRQMRIAKENIFSENFPGY